MWLAAQRCCLPAGSECWSWPQPGGTGHGTGGGPGVASEDLARDKESLLLSVENNFICLQGRQEIGTWHKVSWEVSGVR